MRQIKSHESWESLLLDEEYHCAYKDRLNCFYIVAEHLDLLSVFKYVPSIFDEFILRSHQEALTCVVQMAKYDVQLKQIKSSFSRRMTAPYRKSTAYVTRLLRNLK